MNFQPIELTPPVVIAVLLGALLLGFARWRQAVLSLIFLVVIEGAVRKWLIIDRLGGATIYFFKDALLVGAFLRFWFERRRRTYHLPPLRWRNQLALFAAFLLVEVLNPALPTPLLGAFGFKAYVFYAPLLWMLPVAVETPERAVGLLRRFVYFSIPVLVLGFIQHTAPMNSPLVRYLSWTPGEVGSVASLGDRVRVASTFTFVSGYALYLFVLTVIAFGVALREAADRKPSAPLVALLGVAALLSILMTGSRWPIAALVLVVLAVLSSGMISAKRRIRVVALLGVTAAMVAAANAVGPDLLDRYSERAKTANDVTTRVMSTITKPFAFMAFGGALGFGAGATHQAARVMIPDRDPSDWLPTVEFEEEPARVVLELGVLGFILYYALRLSIFLYVWKMQRGAPATSQTIIAVLALVELGLLTTYVVFDAQASLYVWFFAGLARVFDARPARQLRPAELVVPASAVVPAEGDLATR